MKQPAIYILASKQNGTLYIGVTSDLVKRIFQHKHGFIEGFSKKYGCTQLMYYELYETMLDAIGREKQLKSKGRKTKIALIENNNPEWKDLSEWFFNKP